MPIDESRPSAEPSPPRRGLSSRLLELLRRLFARPGRRKKAGKGKKGNPNIYPLY